MPIHDYLEQAEQQAADRRDARTFAEHLASICYIDGTKRNLVLFLGDREARTNLEALVTWVGRRLKAARELEKSGSDPLDFLYAELLQDLPDSITG